MYNYPVDILTPSEPSHEARQREEYARLSHPAKPAAAPDDPQLNLDAVGAIKARVIASAAGYVPGI